MGNVRFLTLVACLLFIAWMSKRLFDAWEIRHEYEDVLHSTGDEHEHHVAEILRGKRLHKLHVTTALVSFALFTGICVITVVGMRARRATASRWTWIGICLTVGVAASSLLLIGNVYWDTLMLEFVLVGQLLAAILVVLVCLVRWRRPSIEILQNI